MSRRSGPTLSVEWTPGAVRVYDAATGRSASGASLAELRSAVGGKRDVLVGVGRSAVFLKTVRLPRAGADDLRRLLEMRLPQLFPLPADQLSYDVFQTGDVNAEGALSVVAAMRARDLTQLRAELAQAGLKAERIFPAALAAGPRASQAHRSDALVVESGVDGLGLDVVQGGVVRYSRVAPAGSDPRLEVQRTLAAAGAAPDLAVLAPEGAEVPGADRCRLSLEVYESAPPLGFEFPEEKAKLARQRLAARNRLAVLLLASSLLLLTLVWFDWSDDARKVKRSEGTWAREQSRLRSIRDTEGKEAVRASAQRNGLTRAFEVAQPLSDLAAVVSDSLPPQAWLTGLSLERGKPVLLRGTARDAQAVAAVVEALGRNPRFREVRLVFANTAKIDDTPVVQFNITAVAVGNLPLPAPAKASRAARAKGTKAKA